MQKFLNKILETKFNSTLKGLYTMIKWDLSLGCLEFNIHNSVYAIHNINRMKNKNNMIISKDAGKAIWHNTISFHDKNTQLGIEEMHINIIKVIYDESSDNSILSVDRLKDFPLSSGGERRCQLTPPINIILEVL